MFHERLAEALSAAALDISALATMVGLAPERASQIAAGTAQASPEEIRAMAGAFGLRPAEFMMGQAATAPLGLFFRSIDLPTVLPDIAASQILGPLGRFLCAVRDIADLEGRLAVPPSRLPQLHATPQGGDPAWMEAAGRELRTHLGVGVEPIPSMVAACEKLGVSVFLVTPEELDPGVDGVSTLLPRPAVLVNKVEGPGGARPVHRWRMTLAHELAHLLLHGAQRGPLVSPASQRSGSTRIQRKGWSFFEGFGDVEAEADALAACLLAPAAAVEQLVRKRGLDPVSWEAVAAIGGHFGLGKPAAINRLQVVFGLSGALRSRLDDMTSRAYATATREPDSALRFGLIPPQLRGLVRQALEAGLLSKQQAWEILRLRPSEDAPTGWLPRAMAEAPVRPAQLAKSAALKWLRAQGLDSHYPLTASKSFRKWRVSIGVGAPGALVATRAGSLLISDTGDVDSRRLVR